MTCHKSLLSFLILFVVLAECSKPKSNIFLTLTSPLKTRDVVVLEGKFKNRPMMVRFFSSSTTCHGMVRVGSGSRPPCQPLVVKVKPRLHQMTTYYKGAVHTYKDVELRRAINRQHIGRQKAFKMSVEVQEASYEIKLNGETILTTPDMIGHDQIITIRSYGASFRNLEVVKH